MNIFLFKYNISVWIVAEIKLIRALSDKEYEHWNQRNLYQLQKMYKVEMLCQTGWNAT